jgi:hypothetical protein
VNELLEIGTGLKMIEDEHGGLSSESDSTAFDRFLSLVALRGFPTLLSAGHFAFRPQWLFAQTLSDYPEDPRWQRVLPYIQRAIIAGHLPPDYLCMFQDLDDLAHGKPLTYGTMLWSFDQEDVIVLARHDAVDNARAAVGLGPIDHAIALAGLRPEQVTFSEDKNLTPR